MAYFNGILGDVGSGKTNFMTRYLYHAERSGAPVISNYQLIGIKHTLMSFAEFASIMATKNEKFIRSKLEGATIGWDELGIGADSYEFFSKDNRALTELVAYIRKFHITAYFTVQRFSMIARRLRIMTGAFILMEDNDKGRMVDRHGKRARLHRDICEGLFWGTYTNDYLEPVGEPKLFNGRRYWNMYDTDKVIWL